MRAIIRFHKDRVTVLCSRGHLISSRSNKDFAGSMFEAELGAHAAGRPNMLDRQSAACWACELDRRKVQEQASRVWPCGRRECVAHATGRDCREG